MVAWVVRIRCRLLDTVVKPLSSEADRSVVEDEQATPRGSAEGDDSRAAAGVVTALGGVAAAEAEADGGMKW